MYEVHISNFSIHVSRVHWYPVYHQYRQRTISDTRNSVGNGHEKVHFLHDLSFILSSSVIPYFVAVFCYTKFTTRSSASSSFLLILWALLNVLSKKIGLFSSMVYKIIFGSFYKIWQNGACINWLSTLISWHELSRTTTN